jgi:SAM-dependent methyltransferase
MKAPVYDMIHRAERGWWYRGRSAAVLSMVNRAGIVPRGRALDYGAGYGAMRGIFSGYKSVDALEVYPEARMSCATRGYENVYRNDEEMLASYEQYGCVGAFDVIEHIEDDSRFLTEILSKLDPGGLLVATVPAHQFLFGPYDEAAKHFRRYSRAELERKLVAAGFDVLNMSYWNMSLFPIAALLRLFHTNTGGSLSPSPTVDKLLGWIVLFEAMLLRFLPLPMGLSIVFVAQKKQATSAFDPGHP